MTEQTEKRSFFSKVLDGIERIGNKLPHPFMLFIYLAVFLMVVSAILHAFDLTVVDPGTNETVAVRSLLSQEGFLYILSSMLSNFTGFAPFGLVITMMLGIGLAQKAGLFETFMKTTILKAPKSLVTYAVVFAGILGNIASDAAMIIIPPVAAMVFHAIGRHPLAGLAAGFASVGAGFTANFMIAGTDALLAGISTEAARTIDPDFVVTPIDNWFFMSASVVMLVFLGVWITEKIIEKRLGAYDPAYADEGINDQSLDYPTKQEIKALRNAGIALLLYIGAVAMLVVPTNGILRGEEGTIIPSPFIDNIIPILLVMFVVVAVAYGITAGTIKSTADVPILMGDAMKDMAGYIVLVFAAAQFIAYFNWTNIATLIAVGIADFLQQVEFTGLGLFVVFILLVTVLNLFITSGSAQWALMAPVFVPLFMLLDYNPAFTQLAYRIGDSATNVITPMNPYVVMVLGFMKRYDSRAGFGTLMSTMLPYSLIFLGAWIVLFIIWNVVGLPIGPGSGMLLTK
ncbi:AbgT family transporter [Shouchella clausii]|uniref:p-aminobenzoyl-glutamate transporter n=1 Tax=Shouchella clausii TaxID=79880 RepID=A0A268NU61_SHOCL|nr:AbgT family transporter [Shouchella clausii]MBX0320916.1 AbgT family transporter [Shouchella clausii]MDO7270005.1 AbgT family transporter [Shouchella clausii]MDO7286926.1 AbgT family transporter [Shouchella clausii]PAE87042.1 p-aminobenzoyl-glutamate transporter [Shouchella clausii]